MAVSLKAGKTLAIIAALWGFNAHANETPAAAAVEAAAKTPAAVTATDPSRDEGDDEEEVASTPAVAPVPAPPSKITEQLVRDGLIIDFEAAPAEGAAITEGLITDLRFRITEQATGQPVKGITPAAWMDVGTNIGGKAGEIKECRDKVGLYLKGIVGIRPMLDLNGYYLLVLNKDPSISVVDPTVNMAGRTSTYATIVLRRPPMDWVRTKDEKRLFVSMPVANQVAVVDTDRFVVTKNIDAGKNPTRVALQPDGRYVWIGNNSITPSESGVTVIDAQNYSKVANIATGRGHHEVAFTADSRHAFVTNRDDGTVTVIDVAAMKKVKDLKIGEKVLSIGFSGLSGMLYAADGKSGQIAIIDGSSLEITKRIQSKPGLGPLRVSIDGRWAMVANTLKDEVLVIDASTNQVVHTVAVGAEPYQITFSRAFAYIRGLATEKINLINLSTLGEGKTPIVNNFAAGSAPPKEAGELVIADSTITATTETAAFVVNPADNTTYFYMEGMNSPMSTYKNFGHLARAVTLVDRSLKEVEPGVYSTKVRMPVDGRYDVALMLDTPQLVHCFSVKAERNPTMHLAGHWIVEHQADTVPPKVGKPMPIRFKLIDPETKEVRKGVKDATVSWYRAPAFDRRNAVAREVQPGIYEVALEFAEEGAYYAFVEVPSLKIKLDNSAFRSLRVGDSPIASRRVAPAAGAAPEAKQ